METDLRSPPREGGWEKTLIRTAAYTLIRLVLAIQNFTTLVEGSQLLGREIPVARDNRFQCQYYLVCLLN